MGKVLWHTPLSLDGFIAGPGDDMGWVFGVDGGSGQTAEEVVRSTGALLVGRRTQDVEDRWQMGFYGGAFRGPFFVLRHDPPAQPPVVKGVTGQFLDMSIEEAVTAATALRSDSRRSLPRWRVRPWCFATRSAGRRRNDGEASRSCLANTVEMRRILAEQDPRALVADRSGARRPADACNWFNVQTLLDT